MRRDNIVYIRHILDAARKALAFAGKRTRKDMDTDEMLALSLVRLLEIVGEAAAGVSVDYREKHPKIPWNKMVALRNRLIHGYFDVNHDIVWDTVQKDLPPLIKALETLIDD